MRSVRDRVSGAIRRRVLNRWGILYNPYGVDTGLLRFLRPSGPIHLVDIGASEGDVTQMIEYQYGIRRATLVEPQPERCRVLRNRFADSRFSVHECAVSDRETSCVMEVLNWDYSSSILPVKRDLPNVSTVIDLRAKERIECRVTTLDSLLAEQSCREPIDLIKIDVQGAELMVLHGAERTLGRTNLVLTEVSFMPLYEGSCVFGQVYDFLSTHNFRLLSLNEAFRGQDGELLQADALFAR